ncbi:MAG: hypothetical protein FWD17_15885 [Polyangiaceae bacterium]|nr:hypothetical protein [Polyangiaceae bacterium]
MVGTVAGAMGACSPSSTATPYTPYTGVDVPASLVTGGAGCGSDAGIAYFATVIVPSAGDAGVDGAADAGCGELPEASAALAASFVACFAGNASFQLQAAGPVDVWVFGYAGATPGNVSCTEPTCPLPKDPDGGGIIGTLLADQADPATRATRTLKCMADPEPNQHPQAFGCIECGRAEVAGATAPEVDASPGASGTDSGNETGADSGDGAPMDAGAGSRSEAGADAAAHTGNDAGPDAGNETGPIGDASLDGTESDAPETGPDDARGP